MSTHLVHTKLKGQSAVTVRKDCGVSYIKPTESRQVDVDYERLAHTSFQGSYNLQGAATDGPTNDVVIPSQSTLAYFESAHETEMKEYVLTPEFRLKKRHLFVDSLTKLGPLCQHNCFIIILYQ